jgi:F0F1-type ATP synthase membrane subunit b/b'
LTVIGSVLLIFLIILVCHIIGLVKDIRKVINNSEGHITNTITNVDKISEDTSTVVARIIEKVLNLLGSKLEKSAKETVEEKKE